MVGAIPANPHRPGGTVARRPRWSLREDGAFPSPHVLRAIGDAAVGGRLYSAALRLLDPDEAIRVVQEVRRLGPFAAELVVIRGANVPDALPLHERRLDAEVAERYGPAHPLTEISEVWRPFRSWAAVHLRILREERTHGISGGLPSPMTSPSALASNTSRM
ncbi:MAG: hypothetical protein ACR2PL_28485 [Dehalococcoidia bacterium]